MYAKIENDIVIQVQPNAQIGFIAVDFAIAGQISQGDGTFVDPLPVPVTKEEANNGIEIASGAARSRFIATGDLIVEEYRLAATETKAWRAAGSPADNVPSSISSWAVAEGMTNEQSAADIEASEANLDALLLTIRAIRLAGKAAVNAATADYEVVAQGYIDQLDAITP